MEYTPTFNIKKLLEEQIDIYKAIEHEEQELNKHISELDSNIKIINNEIELLDISIKVFNEIINRKNKNYLNSIEKTINQALAFIFEDQLLEFEIKIADKKIEFLVADHLKMIKKDILKVGGGVRLVICFFLQIFFINTRNYMPILFCDESLYDVSQKYREKFFTFIKKYCKSNHFKVVVISHDTTMSKYIEHVINLEKLLKGIEE